MTSAGLFTSSLGKKYLLGLTGLGLALFVLTHMLGNMLLFVSPEAYNTYSYKLMTNPAIELIELGLLAVFLVHVFFAINTTLHNSKARGNRTFLTTSGHKAVTFASKTMIWQGVVVFVFAVHHLITFKYGTHYEAEYNGIVMRDLHRLVLEVFQSPLYTVWYVAAMIILIYHLSHGVQSVFQSLGLNHPKYTPWIKRIGVAYAYVVSLGFAAQPLYVFFFQKQ